MAPPKTTPSAASSEARIRPNARGADWWTSYPENMKLKALEMIEKGEDKKYFEKKLYREFMILVADTIFSDRWLNYLEIPVPVEFPLLSVLLRNLLVRSCLN